MKLHAPYFSEKSKITVGSVIVEIKAFQIVVWVSISNEQLMTWDPRTPRFPAVLDIGSTHNFQLTEEHLMRWAGSDAASFPELGRIRLGSLKVPLRGAGLWLHGDRTPIRLNIDEGIAVFDGDWPRLPVLGLRALTNSKLQTFIYGNTKQVVIRTPPAWYWPF